MISFDRGIHLPNWQWVAVRVPAFVNFCEEAHVLHPQKVTNGDGCLISMYSRIDQV